MDEGKSLDKRFLHIIIEVKSLKRVNAKPVITHLGWTVLPVMTPNNYVISGIF